MTDKISELLRAMIEGDREKEIFLNKDKSPLGVRDIYGNELADFVDKNYDVHNPVTRDLNNRIKKFNAARTNPKINEMSIHPEQYDFDKIKKLYLKSDKLVDTKLRDLSIVPEGANATFNPNTNTIDTRYQRSDLNKLHDILHEGGHAVDVNSPIKDIADKSLLDQMYHANKTVDLMPENMKGLSNAEKVLENHHVGDSIFEREGLMRLLKGGKLGVALPLLKAAGVGALGYQALGIGQKAMAGDIGEASLDAADLGTDMLPVVGQVKDAIRPTPIGNAELPPEVMKERERFNKTKKLLNK